MTKLFTAVTVSKEAERYMAGFKTPAERDSFRPGPLEPDSHNRQLVQSKRVKAANLPPARSPASGSKPFTKFIPGPWTTQLLLLANPGMSVREAWRLEHAINRAHATGSARALLTGAARPTKKATAIATGACA